MWVIRRLDLLPGSWPAFEMDAKIGAVLASIRLSVVLAEITAALLAGVNAQGERAAKGRSSGSMALSPSKVARQSCMP